MMLRRLPYCPSSDYLFRCFILRHAAASHRLMLWSCLRRVASVAMPGCAPAHCFCACADALSQRRVSAARMSYQYHVGLRVFFLCRVFRAAALPLRERICARAFYAATLLISSFRVVLRACAAAVCICDKMKHIIAAGMSPTDARVQHTPQATPPRRPQIYY